MYETLLRPHDVQQSSPLPKIEEVSAKLKQSELRREEKRLLQIASSSTRRAQKRKRESAAPLPDEKESHLAAPTELSANSDLPSDREEPVLKKQITEVGHDVSAGSQHVSSGVKAEDCSLQSVPSTSLDSADKTESDLPKHESASLVGLESSKTAKQPSLPPSITKITLSKVVNEVRGHTSYLTFATLLPETLQSSDPVAS